MRGIICHRYALPATTIDRSARLLPLGWFRHLGLDSSESTPFFLPISPGAARYKRIAVVAVVLNV